LDEIGNLSLGWPDEVVTGIAKPVKFERWFKIRSLTKQSQSCSATNANLCRLNQTGAYLDKTLWYFASKLVELHLPPLNQTYG